MNFQLETGERDRPRTLDIPTVDVPIKLSKDQLQQLSKLNGLRGLFQGVAEWFLIIGSIWACQRFWNPVLYIVTVAFIGARQHALLILMHDGVHYRLFRNRAANEWVAELLLGWPLLISARAYRRNHF